MKQHTITLESIAVEGTDEDRRREIETEIRTQIKGLIKTDLELYDDIQLSIIITDQMAAAVNRATTELGREVSAPYQRERNSTRSVGIVVCSPKRQPVVARIIMDIAPWLGQSSDDIVQRAYLLGHEFGHVLQKGRNAESSWTTLLNPNRSYSDELTRLASLIRDEFDADITACSFCDMCLRDDDGKKVSISPFIGSWHIQIAQDLLRQLCDFASTDVLNYRVSYTGLNDLHPKAGSLISELLTTLAHGVALYAIDEDIESFLSALKKCPGFNEYIEPDWKSFLGSLCGDENNSCEQELVRITSSVFHRVGLIVEDMPEGGIFVHVHEPVIVIPA